MKNISTTTGEKTKLFNYGALLGAGEGYLGMRDIFVAHRWLVTWVFSMRLVKGCLGVTDSERLREKEIKGKTSLD